MYRLADNAVETTRSAENKRPLPDATPGSGDTLKTVFSQFPKPRAWVRFPARVPVIYFFSITLLSPRAVDACSEPLTACSINHTICLLTDRRCSCASRVTASFMPSDKRIVNFFMVPLPSLCRRSQYTTLCQVVVRRCLGSSSKVGSGVVKRLPSFSAAARCTSSNTWP